MGCAASASTPKVPTVAVSDPAADQTWVVEVTKDDQTMLGISTQKADDKLLIVSIFDKGALAIWNRNNPELKVKPGDEIVSVNGHKGNAYTLLDQMWQMGTFQLEVLRKSDATQNPLPETRVKKSKKKNKATDNRFPVECLSHVCAKDTREDCCAVCCEEYTDPDARLVQLPCKHSFHPSCVAIWFETGSRRCPLCNYCIKPHTVFGNFHECGSPMDLTQSIKEEAADGS